MGGVGGDDDGDDGEFLAAVWASGDAVSRWDCVAEAVTGVNDVGDIVDVVGDAVRASSPTPSRVRRRACQAAFRQRGEQ